MIDQLFIATTVIGVLMVSWYLLQSWARKHDDTVSEDGDILETRWGCGGCLHSHSCDLVQDCAQSPTP
ncbi:MAG: hypothetical protein ACE5G0_02115 [Rhodothermales bacterium]